MGKPDMPPDSGGRASGIAVPRLGRRWRPGLTARPVGTGRPKQVSSELRQLAFNAEGMDISDARQGFGYGRALMDDLVDAGKLMGIERIKLRAERVGRYVWVRMGFRPTDDAWLQMRREAFDFIVKQRLALEQKLDVMDLMSRILAGGPKMARTLAAIDVDVPSGQIPARFEPERMPFGKVFFLEIASPWSGTLDLRDDETMKAVESYRQRKVG
jgi:GNAT superfamily N-acetyltransferase